MSHLYANYRQYHSILNLHRIKPLRHHIHLDFRPFGFVAKPKSSGSDGSVDLFEWECIIPGKEGTDWDGGRFPLTLSFSPEYPSVAPKAAFPPGDVFPA